MAYFSYVKSIYEKYIDQLYAYALHWGFDRNVAMDAIHDVFYKLCSNGNSLENVANVKFFLFRSLKNRLIDIYRSNREHAGILASNGDGGNEMSFRLNVSIEDDLIEEEDREEIRQKVEKILNQLTDRQREIIYLRYVQEYSYEEIAALMQISVLSCRNLMSKAVTRIRESTLFSIFPAQAICLVSFF